ncbi:MAG: Na/Pi cotransporter family protein [Proteobacteria bacterium]|nr:Na/Pi cotransporter family protein [Pseudomonadota bacterium]MBU1639718.1 Na/Pi cotransporter family protein [Pseudomonadota bacterium]
MNSSLDLWKLLAGLAIFLYGMFLMEDSIKNMSGKAFRKIIKQYTNGRLRSVASGALITAILQSSAAVSLMVLAFVGAGVMTMGNGIGVIMGSNIGTTFTAWLVAVFGFKLKIESFALPLIAVGGMVLICFGPRSRIFQASRLLMGFGFLFLGLDFMKTSVENFAQHLDIQRIAEFGLWLYAIVGILITALMQSSSVSIAIVLTALNSSLITFPMAAAMVIGANIGSTVTVLLGSIGGIQPKKRVSTSHLIFNVVTGAVAFAALKPLTWVVSRFIDTTANSVMALALFHTLFNVLGVLLFLPFIGILARYLIKIFPDHKEKLTVFLGNTPTQVPDAATASLRNEILHLFEECQLYNLRSFKIDEKLVFDHPLPFEKNTSKRFRLEDQYDNVKLLHGEIFEFYAKLLNEKLEEVEAKELERIIFASRNIMNSIKNIKGVRHNLEEFDASDDDHLNTQYKSFRRRLMELYHDINRFRELDNKQEQYRELLRSIVHMEQADKNFIQETLRMTASGALKEIDIASLLMVNRLFNQACRLQIFALKDLLLGQEQIHDFDHALEMKSFLDEEKAKEVEFIK